MNLRKQNNSTALLSQTPNLEKSEDVYGINQANKKIHIRRLSTIVNTD